MLLFLVTKGVTFHLSLPYSCYMKKITFLQTTSIQQHELSNSKPGSQFAKFINTTANSDRFFILLPRYANNLSGLDYWLILCKHLYACLLVHNFTRFPLTFAQSVTLHLFEQKSRKEILTWYGWRVTEVCAMAQLCPILYPHWETGRLLIEV